MPNPANYKRPPFPNRPWITGKAYDDYARASILHLDAYLFAFGGNEYLILDWREGGFKRIAFDGYLVQPDGLTPVEGHVIESMWLSGVPRYWTRANHATMRGMHARVLAEPARMMALGGWSRVVVQAHYVSTRETDTEIHDGNTFKEYAPRAPKTLDLPDIL